jgi:hypothetical protein
LSNYCFLLIPFTNHIYKPIIMKKIYLFLVVALFSSYFVSAQNTFPSTGNVGIGTTSPGALLDVNGTFRGIIDNSYLGFDAGSDRFGLVKKYGLFGQLAYGSTATFTISQSSGTTIAAGNAFTPRFTIDNSGNVGIGTTNTQGYMLAVNGTAIATAMTVKLYANWPDYVFKKDYQLPPLTEVKTYIDKNQHLPDMPSATEVASDGLNLGEMDRILTKKVEELTLYLIQLKEEMNNQDRVYKEQIEELKKQVSALSIHNNQ